MPEPLPGSDVVADVDRRLAGLVGRPPGEHVAAYEQVHRLLQDALARLDEG